MKKIYIAGPMTGYENMNFSSFDNAKGILIKYGWNPINPADIDRAYGHDPFTEDKTWTLGPRDIAEMLARDLMAISSCDAIFLMNGSDKSKGANIEKIFADIIGIDVYYEHDGYPNP